jgi:peptidoglycan/xylan/chitin deacetylase (PgdA/CDA1 family)
MIRSWAFGLALLVGCRPTPGATPVAPTVDREAPIRVALTVDDLPTHGAFPPGMTHLQAHEKMLAAFAAHEVPKVYGFVNTGRTIDGQDADAPLRAWLAAGHPLGNHTQAHGRMKEMGVPAYLADIDLNDRVLATLVPDERTRRVFRYPFLYEGSDPASTRAVREHLAANRYRIAEVTIDFYDWAFNGPYVRCLALGDQNALDALRKTYVQHAIRMLQWSDEAARRVWQRPVPHILLMHVGSFSAEMIEPVLTAYEAENVEWITLDDAMEDPIYADLPVADGVTQGTLIEAMVDARGVDHPPWPEHPEALLGALCPTGA